MRIAILGTGRMGSWLAREFSPCHTVAVYDKNIAKTAGLEGVRALGSLDEVGRFEPQLLINAVGLEDTVHVFRLAEEFVAERCVRCDVASIKQAVADYYRQGHFRFVSVHPMFGPTFADMERLRGEHGVIIEESDPEGAALFRDLFARRGVAVVNCPLADHDRLMAYSLTIPFVSSMAFAACLDVKTVPGTTFKRHKAIATGLLSEDDRLLSEILFNPFSIRELDRVTARLEFLKHVIRARDYEEAHAFFDALRKNLE